jgi:hypothetical protein
MALQPLWDMAAFQFPDLFTIGRTPSTSDQPVARALPKHRANTNTEKHIYIPNIRALSGIRTHDHSVRASEDSSCFRPLGYSDRRTYHVSPEKRQVSFKILLLTNERSYFRVLKNSFFFSLRLYSPLDLGRFFSFLILYTDGRTPWTSDLVARPLPTHRIKAHRHLCLE